MIDRSSSAPLLIGHRGAPGYWPEHTASCYRLAFEQGVDAVEPDIVVSSDGVLVIRHENEISGTTNVADRPEFVSRRTTKTVDGVELTGWFAEDFTWQELQVLRCRERLPNLRPENTRFDGEEPMLSLRQLLEMIDAAGLVESATQGSAVGALSTTAAQQKIKAVIEIKHADYLLQQGHDLVELLFAELHAAGWHNRPEQLIIESFEMTPLERLQNAGLVAEYVFLLESIGSPADEVARLGSKAHSYEWYRSDAGLDSLAGRVHGISVSKRELLQSPERGSVPGTTDVVSRAHDRGLRAFTWTLRPENQFLAANFQQGSEPARWGDWRAEWQLILSTGVDGVFLDHPDLLKEVL